jgi:hypothetical protein
MVSWIWIVVAILVVAAIAAAAWQYTEKQRAARLRSRFGPEYDRVIQEHGKRGAVAELERRQKRIEALEIRPLKTEERDAFADQWRVQQGRFVDDPRAAVAEADRLVAEVMRRRGYPMSDFEQRAADISVDHPRVVEHYRVAHDIALRHQRGEASTEDLRNAMVHYRALFEELLGGRVRVAGGH